MSDGHLLEQAKAKAFKTTWQGELMTLSKDSILLDDLEKILEGARTRFPTLKQIEEDYGLKKDDDDQEKILAIWITLAVKRGEWFVEQFGTGAHQK